MKRLVIVLLGLMLLYSCGPVPESKVTMSAPDGIIPFDNAVHFKYKTVDQLTGIAEASAQMFEHVHLGQVTVYGNENTAGNFMAKTAENLNPAFDLLRSIPFADTLKSVLGKKELEEKKAETTEFEEVK